MYRQGNIGTENIGVSTLQEFTKTQIMIFLLCIKWKAFCFLYK